MWMALLAGWMRISERQIRNVPPGTAGHAKLAAAQTDVMACLNTKMEMRRWDVL